jgi:hypothetical protein
LLELSLGSGEGLRIAAADGHGSAQLGKAERGGAADATIATGDEGDGAEERGGL